MITHHLLSERPELIEQADALNGAAWPEPMYHNSTGNCWGALFDPFLEYQLVFCDEGRVIAVGHTIPLRWAGTLNDLPAGWDAVLVRGVEEQRAGVTPNTLSALAAVIAPEYKGKGLSQQIILAMRQVAAAHNFGALIAPVRPNQKALYPLIDMERYLQWQNAKQEPFDAWVRTHWKLGARILKVAPQSMVIKGNVAEWEQWTGLKFPDSGAYVVAGLLAPVQIDRSQDLGLYNDENVWMQHSITKEQ